VAGSGKALCYNPTDNKVYLANWNGQNSVAVIDGATDVIVDIVTVGIGGRALCYNPTDNKVYCANYGIRNVTVIDGETNWPIATVVAGGGPYALCYNSRDNQVYCLNQNSASVTVIDGATNGVDTTVGVGAHPMAIAWNQVQNRVYTANYGSSSISVLRDSALGIEQSFKPHAASPKPTPTVIRGVLFLSASLLTPDCYLLSIVGRKALVLRPGANDVSRLSPGVYFVRGPKTEDGRPGVAVTKVVIQR
jgi:YVTN family beta-propeller protein